MRAWYGISIAESSILDEIGEVKRYTDREGKTLFIRDWSFGSFISLKYNDFSPPQTLNTIDDIGLRYKITPFCIVRNPIDVWLSMKNSLKSFHDKHLEYLHLFTKDILRRGLPILKYEDLCSDPLGFLDKVYKLMNLTPIRTMSLSDNVTGDNNLSGFSRGSHLREVIRLERRKLERGDALFLLNNTRASEIMNVLNYSLDPL
jgi:hypothetical protein